MATTSAGPLSTTTTIGGPPRVVLIIGSGAREHALAWRLAAEPGVERVLAAPGNPLISDVAQVDAASATDFDGLVGLCRLEAVELVVVGPEQPLVHGLADRLADEGIPCLGPTAAAARLEGSKSFCRRIADLAEVPMAEGEAFDDASAALAYAARLGAPLVVKADGLAAGKGVAVCDTLSEAEEAIRELMHGGRFGRAGRTVVVERRLEGREASLIALCDGRDAMLLPVARDHKRLLDDDRGPNTGGMGAYSPVEDVGPDAARAWLATIHRPVLAAMARRGTPFTGFLYAGLMLTADRPRLLEFNARLGDPEAQAILPRIDAPLAVLLAAAARGELRATADALGIGEVAPQRTEAAVALAVAAAGYPDAPRDGDEIRGIEAARAEGALVFGAGVARTPDGGLVSAGGRVLSVVGRGNTVAEAAEAAYRAAARIEIEGGAQLRRDIGASVRREVGVA
ncbi:phosphoribosylamine--glycine ligase [soil metagenome]